MQVVGLLDGRSACSSIAATLAAIVHVCDNVAAPAPVIDVAVNMRHRCTHLQATTKRETEMAHRRKAGVTVQHHGGHQCQVIRPGDDTVRTDVAVASRVRMADGQNGGSGVWHG